MAPLTPCFAVSAPLANPVVTQRRAATCSPCRTARLRHRTRVLRAVADPPTDPERETSAAAPAPSAPAQAPVAAEPVAAADDVVATPPIIEDDEDLLDEVPGKIVLTETELIEQKRKLEKLAEKYRTARLDEEREAARLFGWVKYAETMNGRFAMFFFVTGLLTEYWTGYTIPEQIELMLRTLGVI